jgi:4-amino-4-deoxy-L-arabinose transferase-like glycosyltransferase
VNSGSTKKTWQVVTAVGLIAAVALGARLVYGLSRTVLTDHDSTGYIFRAREIFEGGSFFHPFHVPGYPLLIGIWSLPVGDDILAAKIASIVCGALLSLVAYALGSELYGRKVGWAAAALIAFNVGMIDVSASEISESTYILTSFTALALAIWAMQSERLVIWLLAGVLAGLCYWVRPEGILYVGLIPALAILDSWLRNRRFLSKRLALHLVAFVAVGSSLAVPNVWHIYRTTGAWSINARTAWAALIHGEPSQDPLAYERALGQLTPSGLATMKDSALSHVAMTQSYSENAVYRAKAVVKNLDETYRLLPAVFPVFLIMLMGVGLLARPFRLPDRAPDFILAGALLPWFVVYPLYEIDFENLAPVVPVLTLWAAVGLVEIAGRLGRRLAAGYSGANGGRRLNYPLLVLVAVAMMLELPSYVQKVRNPTPREDHPIHREVGDWIQANLAEDAVILSRKGFVPLYGNREQAYLPFAEYDEVIAHARSIGADYLLLEERLRDMRPQLAFLLEDPEDTDDLVLEYENHAVRGRSILLFRILPASP